MINKKKIPFIIFLYFCIIIIIVGYDEKDHLLHPPEFFLSLLLLVFVPGDIRTKVAHGLGFYVSSSRDIYSLQNYRNC